jgi:hypothetical protein
MSKESLPNYMLEASDDENFVFETSLVSNPATKQSFYMFSDESEQVVHRFKSFEVSNGDAVEYMISGIWFEPDTKYVRRTQVAPNTYTEYTVEVTREELQKIVINNKKQGFNDSFMLEHKDILPMDFTEVESWIYTKQNQLSPLYQHSLKDLGYDESKVKEGTVFKTVFVGDKQFWEDYIVTGKIKGFSIGGKFNQRLENFNDAMAVAAPVEQSTNAAIVEAIASPQKNGEEEVVDSHSNPEVEAIVEEVIETIEPVIQNVEETIEENEVENNEADTNNAILEQEALNKVLNEEKEESITKKFDTIIEQNAELMKRIAELEIKNKELETKVKDESEVSALLAEQQKNTLIESTSYKSKQPSTKPQAGSTIKIGGVDVPMYVPKNGKR